jgi:peptidoglycan hydrolase CwlO-like protein
MPYPPIEEVDEIPPEKRNLGETLRLGVNNLWKAVNDLRSSNQAQNKKDAEQDKIIAYLTGELERLSRDVSGLRREMHGLKVSAGKARAAKARMEAELVAAEAKLDDARHVLLH